MTVSPETMGAMQAMAQSFNPNKAKGVNATIQFRILGEDGANFVVKIADQKINYTEGLADAPNATIDVKAHDWYNIMTGQLDPAAAFMNGKLRIGGDLGLMMRFQQMFAS